MSLDALTDEQIAELLACPKRVENPGSRERLEGKHKRCDYRVRSHDERHEFVLFTRQSTLIPRGFTAGLRWKSESGEEVILIRCNGSDHPHSNAIERERFEGRYHIHRATERYAVAGRKAESFAETTDAFRTLDGALHHLVKLTNIDGLPTCPDEPELFETP